MKKSIVLTLSCIIILGNLPIKSTERSEEPTNSGMPSLRLASPIDQGERDLLTPRTRLAIEAVGGIALSEHKKAEEAFRLGHEEEEELQLAIAMSASQAQHEEEVRREREEAREREEMAIVESRRALVAKETRHNLKKLNWEKILALHPQVFELEAKYKECERTRAEAFQAFCRNFSSEPLKLERERQEELFRKAADALKEKTTEERALVLWYLKIFPHKKSPGKYYEKGSQEAERQEAKRTLAASLSSQFHECKALEKDLERYNALTSIASRISCMANLTSFSLRSLTEFRLPDAFEQFQEDRTVRESRLPEEINRIEALEASLELAEANLTAAQEALEGKGEKKIETAVYESFVTERDEARKSLQEAIGELKKNSLHLCTQMKRVEDYKKGTLDERTAKLNHTIFTYFTLLSQ